MQHGPCYCAQLCTQSTALQVLTPVRRSARKVKASLAGVGQGGGAATTTPALPVQAVQPMLEATNYCYQPNEALQK